jgi:Holliday junction resolvasome RuvABC endonuclease subunit
VFGESELLKPKAWIGIDQSYSGFGLIRITEDDVVCNIWDFTKKKPGDSERLRIIMDMVSHELWCYEHKYDCSLAIEGYAHGAKFNREKLGELGGIVKLAIYDVFKLEPIIVPPTVLKKYVTGKGNASKAQMMEGVAKKWGPQFDNDNLADAYALAQYCKESMINSS